MKLKYLPILILGLFFLSGCQKTPLPEGFKLPATPPNPATMQPLTGPNDPAPNYP